MVFKGVEVTLFKNGLKIGVSQQPLEQSQIRQQQSIRKVLISRTGVSVCIFQWGSHDRSIGQTAIKALILAFLHNRLINLHSDNSNQSARFFLVGQQCRFVFLTGVEMIGSSVNCQYYNEWLQYWRFSTTNEKISNPTTTIDPRGYYQQDSSVMLHV